MYKKIQLPILGTEIYFLQLWFLCLVTTILASPDSSATAILLNANPVNVRRVFYDPMRIVKKRKSPPFYDFPSQSDNDYYYDTPMFPDGDALHIRANDAVDKVKFSSPVIESHPTGSSSHPPYHEKFIPSLYSTPSNIQNPSLKPNYHLRDAYSPITKGYKKFPSDFVISEATVTSNYQVSDKSPILLSDEPTKDEKQMLHAANKTYLLRNNFTEINESQLSEPSNKVLKSGSPMLRDDSGHIRDKHQQPKIVLTSGISDGLPNNTATLVPFTENKTPNISNYSKKTNISDLFTTPKVIDFIGNETLTTPDSFDVKENFSRILPPIGSSHGDISSGALAGVILGILSVVTILSSSVIYLLYKKFNGKCTSVVDSKFNSDNCGYLDDSLRSSIYLNNHIELPKENSEEMTSLDNDSFLNSLETMTIQNYWADNTKNTKV